MVKIAVVTGGAGGMGLAAARVIGRDCAVLICDVDAARLASAQRDLNASGVDCATATCDITDPASVRQLVEQAQQLGTVMSVVHTAGVSPSMGSAEMILRINALGTVLVNEAFLGIAQPGMAVVNVASVAGHQLPGLAAPTRRYKRALQDRDRFYRDLLSSCNRIPRRVAQQHEPQEEVIEPKASQ